MREERMHGVESKHRNRPVAESLAIFQQMVDGTEEGLRHCIRYKMDMQVGREPFECILALLSLGLSGYPCLLFWSFACYPPFPSMHPSHATDFPAVSSTPRW